MTIRYRRWPILLGCLLSSLVLLQCRPMHQRPLAPEAALQGDWQCRSSIRQESDQGQEKDRQLPVEICLHIDASGRVSGSLGEAQIVDALFQANRGALGRRLNIKTDYIIQHGVVRGPIYVGDPCASRNFTLPCNLEAGRLVGTIMVLNKGQYPKPLTRRLAFEKAGGAG